MVSGIGIIEPSTTLIIELSTTLIIGGRKRPEIGSKPSRRRAKNPSAPSDYFGTFSAGGDFPASRRAVHHAGAAHAPLCGVQAARHGRPASRAREPVLLLRCRRCPARRDELRADDAAGPLLGFPY